MKNKRVLIVLIASVISILLIATISTIILSNQKKNNKNETTTTTNNVTTTNDNITTTTNTTTSETTTEVVNDITTSTTTTTQIANTRVTEQVANQSYRQTTTKIVSEDRNEYTPIKYNVRNVITYKDTYKVYENGTKELLSTSQKSTSIDYSTFSATTYDLKGEAQQLANSNASSFQEMLGYVNELRTSVGVNTLTIDPQLNLVANIRALELGWSRKFAHERPNGTKCFTVVSDLGYNYHALGENIYSYTSTADARRAYNAWYNSPGHYENMVSTYFTKLGVGKAIVNGTTYWVQFFGG